MYNVFNNRKGGFIMEIEVKSKQSTFTGLIAKSFAWMALALLITAGVAIGGQ